MKIVYAEEIARLASLGIPIGILCGDITMRRHAHRVISAMLPPDWTQDNRRIVGHDRFSEIIFFSPGDKMHGHRFGLVAKYNYAQLPGESVDHWEELKLRLMPRGEIRELCIP